MQLDHEQIVEILREACQFPEHALIQLAPAHEVLVFPFRRAVAQIHSPGFSEFLGRPVLGKDLYIVSCFNDRWMRLLYVLRRLASIERILQSNDHSFEWIQAHEELPCWLDLFFLYAPVFADTVVQTVGWLLSRAPASFPREAKSFFGKTSWIEQVQLRCPADKLRIAIEQHSDWFTSIRPLQGKGIRDSIVHRLSQWQVIQAHSPVASIENTIEARLSGLSEDIAEEEALSTIRRTMAGMFGFFTALPSECWMHQNFLPSDITGSSGVGRISGKFLPVIRANH